MTRVFENFTSQRLEKLPPWQYKVSLVFLIVGSISVFLGVLGASTNSLMALFNVSFKQSWEFAGVVGGIGAYLLLASIPFSTPRVKDKTLKIAEKGGLIILLAILLFVFQFPENWNIYQWDTIALVAVVYIAGLSITLISSLNAVIGFEVRKTPGGEVVMQVESNRDSVTVDIQESTLRDDPHYALKGAVEDLNGISKGSVGGIGFIGNRPDEFVETQTNRPDRQSVSSDD